MNVFMPIMAPDKVQDYSEQVKRIASFLQTSAKKKTLGNVIFAEAGLYSDGDGGPLCLSCHFRLENISSSLNLTDICKYHLSCSPNCDVALGCLKALKCAKTTDQVKANLCDLAATFTNKTQTSVKVSHNGEDCRHPSSSEALPSESLFVSSKIRNGIILEPKLNSLLPIASASTKNDHYQCSNGTEAKTRGVKLWEARGIDLSKPSTGGYSEYQSARVGEHPLKNGAASDNFSKTFSASIPTSDSQTTKQSISYYQQSVEARRRTFAKWPLNSPVKPDDLAEAGFIYGGKKDNVKCVFCSGSLCEWEVGDVPKEEHDKHFPLCKKRWMSSDESRNPRPKLTLEFDDVNISLRGGAASSARHPEVEKNSVGTSSAVEEITKSVFSIINQIIILIL